MQGAAKQQSYESSKALLVSTYKEIFPAIVADAVDLQIWIDRRIAGQDWRPDICNFGRVGVRCLLPNESQCIAPIIADLLKVYL